MAFPHDGRKFKKGQSGNPKGRPTKLPELDALLAEVMGTDGKGPSGARQILQALVDKAVAGDVRAAEVLLNRAYGKPKQAVDVTTTSQPIKGFHSLAEAFWADVKPKE